MQLIEISKIIIPTDRQRRDLDEVEVRTLAESIEKYGLFHSILLEGDGLTLCAGRRRLAAVAYLSGAEMNVWTRPPVEFYFHGEEKIPPGFIPFISKADITGLRAKEAELDENIQRINLTWQERTDAISQLHALRVDQASARGEFHSQMDTKRELGTTSDISAELALAPHLNDPEVRKAKTKDEAMKIVRKKLEKEHRETLAQSFDLSKLQTPHSLVKGDLFNELPKLPNEHFDCIVTDPPYGIDADQFRNQSASPHTYRDDQAYSDAIVKAIAAHGFRICKPKAHMYMFCDILRFKEMEDIVAGAGWYVWKWPLIWSKGTNAGIAPRPEHGPRRTYEAILYAIKGDRKTNDLRADVLTDSVDRSVERGAHKSPEVYANLITRTCLPGQRVLDPCCGAGTIFPAGDITRTIATGIEISEDGYALSLQRIREPAEAREEKGDPLEAFKVGAAE